MVRDSVSAEIDGYSGLGQATYDHMTVQLRNDLPGVAQTKVYATSASIQKKYPP